MRISDWSSDVCSSDRSNCESECKRRNVIGRAYYAVYHRADLFHRSLPQPGLAAPDGGKHKQLWYALTNPTVNDNKIKMTSRKIGYLRSEEHTSELQSLMRISYAVFCLKKTNKQLKNITTLHTEIYNNIHHTIIY